jgi:hypothetical protein
MSSSVGRPIGVTVVVVLVVLNGLSALIAGVLLLFTGTTSGGAEGPGWAVVTGSIVYIIVGLLYLLVARGLWNGNTGARTVAMTVTVIRLLASIWMAFLLEGAQRIEPVAAAVVSILILVALSTARAKAFFAESTV